MVVERLEGKVGVVTGGASGIGFGIAGAFAGEGMRVVLADVDRAGLDDAVAQLRETGAACTGVVTDVSDADAVEALATAAEETFGAVHVVCNNAGVGGRYYPAWEAPPAYWDWVLGVSLHGVINGIRSFVPRLLRRGEGHVVNTASIGGLIGTPYSAPYSAAKHAIVGISRSLYSELAGTDTFVGVSVLCPGAVATRFVDGDRTWPSELGPLPPPSDDPRAQAIRTLLETSTAAGATPVDVGARVVDAVRTGRFLVLTEDELAGHALEAFRSSIAGGPPTPPLFR
jgi:NAD(P)-dependent dehydrogenase (short-subunit alcohol dehydrogenase family)